MAGVRCMVVPLLLALAACGGETPLPETTPEPTTTSPDAPTAAVEDGPVGAYTAWLDALEAQDARAACRRQAYDFTIALRFEAVLLDRAELGDPCTGFVAVLWEQPDREYTPVSVEVTQETREDALLAVDFAGRDRTVEMQVRDGGWYVLEEQARNQPLPTGADPERWLDAWCDLELDMSVVDLRELMGRESGTYTIADGGEPQLYWTQDQYDFRAYLDADPPAGGVLDLVGDYDRLTVAERAGLTCPELR